MITIHDLWSIIDHSLWIMNYCWFITAYWFMIIDYEKLIVDHWLLWGGSWMECRVGVSLEWVPRVVLWRRRHGRRWAGQRNWNTDWQRRSREWRWGTAGTSLYVSLCWLVHRTWEYDSRKTRRKQRTKKWRRLIVDFGVHSTHACYLLHCTTVFEIDWNWHRSVLFLILVPLSLPHSEM